MEESLVSFQPAGHLLNLNEACVLVDDGDFTGIHIAADLLAKDFGMVIGSPLPFIKYNGSFDNVQDRNCVIVGSVQSSRLIQTLIRDGKLKVDDTRGHWESFVMTVVDLPVNSRGSLKKALVIAGSDNHKATTSRL